MNNEMVMKEGTSSVLEKVFNEQPATSLELENRWKKGLDAIFSFLASLAARFFLSNVKSEELVQTQSYIRRIFRKTDYVEKIKGDIDLQNAFLLGYCHGFDRVVDAYDDEISLLQNESLKSVILSYKYVEPILRILDKTFEISHNELAEQLGIEKSALSNCIKKVDRYRLFNYTYVGKKKYYSLAYPNGKAALKIIKNDSSISVNSYTEFLMRLLDSLRKISLYDELGKDYVIKECEAMILQYTTKPALCKKKLEDLTRILKSERVYFISLATFEEAVKNKVTIFTRDIKGEEAFKKTIIGNLEKKIIYQWYIVKTEQFDSEKKVKDYFLNQFSYDSASDNIEKFSDYVQCYLISEEESNSLLGDIYDAVIYDEKEGFSCEDETISNATPYIRMPQVQIERLNQYVRTKNI